MAKHNAVRRAPGMHALGIAANNFLRTHGDEPELFNDPYGKYCHWYDCPERRFDYLPVCVGHALTIAGWVHRNLGSRPGDSPVPGSKGERQGYVYYLMVGPTTVKIGTTKDLTQRMSNLRTNLQYVVALERGGMDLERQRHKEFAEERIGRREDFRLSERLKAHIEALQPSRDELIAVATTFPLQQEGVA